MYLAMGEFEYTGFRGTERRRLREHGSSRRVESENWTRKLKDACFRARWFKPPPHLDCKTSFTSRTQV